MKLPSSFLLSGGGVATMAVTPGYGFHEAGAVAVKEGRIAWAGPKDDMPEMAKALPEIPLDGRLATPALIDCHTHVVHAGSRAREFEARLNGASYEEIAKAGGGIISTVKATRAAGEAALLEMALRRVDQMAGMGVGTIEVKSGYGLDIETELSMLRVARRIGQEREIGVSTSFLGAHAVPTEYNGRSGAYLEEVCLPALRAAHAEGLVDAVDGFCEGIAFSPQEIQLVFDTAKELGLAVKLHAEQLSNIRGAEMAARNGALSADHLEYLDEAGVAAMKQAGTVAVILPGAFYTLRETQAPPVEALRQAGVPMAVATDMNPGSSPMVSLPLAMNMACTLFQMTPEEALAGVTCHAAKALGLNDRGMIAPEMRADLAVWEAEHPAELSYLIGGPKLHQRIIGGVLC